MIALLVAVTLSKALLLIAAAVAGVATGLAIRRALDNRKRK